MLAKNKFLLRLAKTEKFKAGTLFLEVIGRYSEVEILSEPWITKNDPYKRIEVQCMLKARVNEDTPWIESWGTVLIASPNPEIILKAKKSLTYEERKCMESDIDSNSGSDCNYYI